MESSLKITYVPSKDCEVITFLDQSLYNPDLPILNPLLEIKLPNGLGEICTTYVPRNLIHITSDILTLTGTPMPIMSGVYTFRFSIAPNADLYHEFKLFMMCEEQRKIEQLLCMGIELEDIYELKMQLWAAKQLVESCCKEREGILLYNQIVKQLNKIC